jgi:hypothetical protein
MPRAIVRAACLAVLVVMACSCGSSGGSAGSAAQQAGGALAPAWTAIAQALEKGADNVCSRGEPRCVDAVVTEMRARLTAELGTCDHLLPWTLIYLRVTETLGQLRSHSPSPFADPVWVTRLDAAFADLWFKADDAWRAGRTEEATPAWRAVYQAAGGKQVNAIGNLVMAMNAHISGDLPRALASVQAGTQHHDDFVRANQLFEQNFMSGLAEVARRFDPTASNIVVPGIGETQAVVAAIAAWREEAFANSQHLLATAAGSAERVSALAAVDASAAGRAATLQIGTSYVPFTGAATSRDAFCGQHGA